MILPTIHTNGSSAKMLLESYEPARAAIRGALLKLEAVEFNGRDYYPQGATAWTQARAEHEARLKKLREVEQEVEAIVEHLYDEAEKREVKKVENSACKPKEVLP